MANEVEIFDENGNLIQGESVAGNFDNPGPISSGSIGFNQIGQTGAALGQLGSSANQLGGSLNTLGQNELLKQAGLDFEVDIPTVDLATILNLLGINLDELRAEKQAALAELQGHTNQQFIDQLQSVPKLATNPDSLNTSSLDPFKNIPTKIEFGDVIGTLVDFKTREPIVGAKIRTVLLKRAVTDEFGIFEIKQPIIPKILLDEGILPPSKIPLIITKKGYSPKTIIPYTSAGDLKTGLNVETMKPLASNLKNEILKLLKFPDNVVDDYTTKYKTYDFTIQKELNASINNLKGVVIPLLLSLVAIYGVSEIEEIIKEAKEDPNSAFNKIRDIISCPASTEMSNVIATKNKLVKVINGTLKVITFNTDLLAVTSGIINIADTTYQILKVLPTPTAIAGVGIPISVVNLVEDIKIFLANNIGKFKHINNTTLNILRLLEVALGQVLDLLNLLDLLVQFCNTDGNQLERQEEVSQELITLTRQEAVEQTSPVVTNVNGFTMEVETEKTNKALKRRRALARNKQGVVMLTGEYSFSSVDQILIDELVFYIQQNNLKAD